MILLSHLRRLTILSAAFIVVCTTAISAAQAEDREVLTCREKSHGTTTPLIIWGRCVRQETQDVLENKCHSKHRLHYIPYGTAPRHLREWLLKKWLGRRQVAEAKSSRCVQVLVPHYNQWMCIHSHEGAWTANTGNGYYGGLQMDISFQRAYGSELLNSKGTANNWTPIEQMMVAERAYKSRGFSPWPNTARYCGLL